MVLVCSTNWAGDTVDSPAVAIPVAVEALVFSVAEVVLLADVVMGPVGADASNRALACCSMAVADRAAVAKAPVAWAEPATGTTPSTRAHRPAKSPTRTTRRAVHATSCSATHRRSALARGRREARDRRREEEKIISFPQSTASSLPPNAV